MLGADELARLVAIKLHAIELTQQVVGKLDVRLVDFVDEQRHRLLGRERLPQHALHDVVVDHLRTRIAQLAVAQAVYRVVFVQPLLGLGGGFDVPLQEWQAQRLGGLFGQHGFAGARFALDQQGALQLDGGIDGQHQIGGGDVILRTLEFHSAKSQER